MNTRYRTAKFSITALLFLTASVLIIAACNDRPTIVPQAQAATSCDASEKGTVRIISNPGKAKVYVDGNRKGTTPEKKGQTFAVKLCAGEYVLKLTKAIDEKHHYVVEEEVFVAGDTLQTVDVKLKKERTPKYLAKLKSITGLGTNAFVKISATGKTLPNSAGSWSCVRDNNNGLMWEVKTNDGGIHNKDKKYRWGGKGVSTIALDFNYLGNNKRKGSRWDGKGERFNDWNTLVNGSNSEQLCGKSDWRVPDLYELASLVHCSKGGYDLDAGCTVDGHKKPTIDTRYFPNTDDAGFWSASPYAHNGYNAWNVYFSYGYDSYYYYRISTTRLRLVRGGQ